MHNKTDQTAARQRKLAGGLYNGGSPTNSTFTTPVYHYRALQDESSMLSVGNSIIPFVP